MLRKKMIRKCTAVIITGALTIATAATVMATPQGNGGNGPGGGNGGPIQGVGQRFQMQQGPGDGERPEPPEGKMSQFGADERPELSVGGGNHSLKQVRDLNFLKVKPHRSRKKKNPNIPGT